MPGIKSFFKEIKKASRGHKIVSLGIEFGSSSIKVVELIEDKGVVSLGNYGEIDLGPLIGKPPGSVANVGPDKLEEGLRMLLDRVKINDPEAVSVSIPLSATLVVPVEFQLSPDEKLEKKIKDKIEPHVPVPLEQVYVDWQVIGEGHKMVDFDVRTDVAETEGSTTGTDEPAGESGTEPTTDSAAETIRAICFVINKEVINDYETVLNNLDLGVEYFELEVYSVLRSAVPKNIPEATIIDIGARYTKIYSIKNGEIIGALKKLHGGRDYTEIIETTLGVEAQKAEELKRNINLRKIKNGRVAAKLQESVDQLVFAVNLMQKETKISHQAPVYLCGGGSLLYGLPEYLAEKKDTKIIICQPFINTKAPAYLDKLLVETGPEYAVATGLALKYIRQI